MKKAMIHFFSVLVLFGIFWGISKAYEGSQNDPDRFYHFALSRYMVEQGGLFPKEYPPVEDLGWGEYFTDKEFLYHQITRIGYWLAKDEGVISISLAISFSSLVLVYFFGATIGSVPLGFAASLMLLFSPAIYPRLFMVRPHVLAIFAFIGLIGFLIRRQPKWVLAFSLVFSLAYHAIYVPGLFFLAMIVSSFIYQSPKFLEIRKVSLFGIVGLVLGILLNPYFPSNLVSAWQISQIPGLMTGALSHISFGQELYAVGSNHFLQLLMSSLLVTVAGIYFWGKSTDSDEKVDFYLLVLLCFFTGALAFLSRRGAEYFVPSTVFLFIFTAKSLWSKDYEMWKRLLFPVGGIVLITIFFIKDVQRATQVKKEKYVEDSLLAARILPDESIKVFNCEWDLAPYILYQKPKARVTDLLDPSLLYFANPPLFQAKSKLQQGLVGNPQALLKELFRADYVFCQNPVIVQQLQKDPFFLQLYPKFTEKKFLSESVPHIFRIENTDSDERVAFLKKAKGKFFSQVSEEEFLSLSPASKAAFEEELDFTGIRILNFEQFFKNRTEQLGKGQGLANCVLVQAKEGLGEFAGSEYLTIGGGRNIRVWRGNKKIYESGKGFTQNILAQTVIPLNPKLGTGESLDFIVCSGSGANFWSFSASFLNRTQFKELCLWKNSQIYPNATTVNSEFIGTNPETCIGTMAIQPLPTEYWPGQLNRLY